jgi:hypothetical protein
MVTIYRHNTNAGVPPNAGTMSVFGDSLSDPRVTVTGIMQGQWRLMIAAALGLSDIGRGAIPANAVLGTPVSNAGHQVTSVPITTAGAAYATAPAVTITGGTFTTQATAHAVLGADGSVVGIVIDNAGTYTVNATGATIAGCGIVNAVLTPTIAGGAVTGLTVGTAGDHYPLWGASIVVTPTGGDTITDLAWIDGTTATGSGSNYALTGWNAAASHGGAGYAHVPGLNILASNNHQRGAIASTTLIDNTAFGGVDPGILTYQNRIVNANANLVIIWYGTNDLNGAGSDVTHVIDASFTPALFKTAYQTVLTAIRGQASKPYIILVGLPQYDLLPTTQYLAYTPAWATSRQNAIAQYNQVIQQLAWDNNARYASLQGSNPALHNIAGINIHQTVAGQTFVSQRVLEAIYS